MQVLGQGFRLRAGLDVVPADPDEVRPPDDGRRAGRVPVDGLPGLQDPQQPLPADGDQRALGRHGRPLVPHLGGDRGEHPGTGRPPRLGQGARVHRVRHLRRALEAPGGGLDVDEDRAAGAGHEPEVDAGLAHQPQLGRRRRLVVRDDQRPDPQPEPRERERRVRRAAAQPPAAGIVVHEVAAGRPHDHDLRCLVHRPSREPGIGPAYTGIMHFYELHEGDDDVFADLLLFRDDEMDAEEFFELVQSIRRRVIEGYEASTLVEAIADELERDHGFVAVTDDRLTAAVNVSREEEENFLADLDAPEESVDYATILADLQAEGGRPN